MSSDYLALLDWSTGVDLDRHARTDSELRRRGLQSRWQVGPCRIYAGSLTQFVDLGPGGLLIGELHLSDGTAITRREQLPPWTSGASIRDYILSRFWGEYVLFQPVPGDPAGLGVLRSPSHACEVSCLFATAQSSAFVTSDVSLAFETGLHVRKVDMQNLVHRIAYPEIKIAPTALNGITELLPGQRLELRHGRSAISANWTPWTYVQSQMRFSDFEDAVRSVSGSVQMVTKALAKRHRKIMVELSGGLDSSIVAAGIHASGAIPHCATMMSKLPGSDERDYAGAVAEMLGASLLEAELHLDEGEFTFDLPKSLAVPLVGPLQYGLDRLMQDCASRAGAEGVFCGAGGDTVFCYLTSAAPAADAFRRSGIRAGLHTVSDLAAFHQCTYWKVAKLTLAKLWNASMNLEADTLLVNPGLALPAPQLHPWMQGINAALPGDQRRVYELGGVQTFQDSCLRRAIRPLRMPLLSQPVIEACLRAPSWMWFCGGQNRAVARRGFSTLLPANVIARRSKGTLTAYLGAFYRRRKSEIIRFLTDGELSAHGLLDVEGLMQLRQEEIPQPERVFLRILQLCMIENWLRQQARHSRESLPP